MAADAPDRFDVVVIGGGPGGYAAALYGAAANLRVALVEQDKVGGTCLHRGCIPAKALLESATMARSFSRAKDFGFDVATPRLDFAATQARKNRIVEQLWKGLSGLIASRSITVFEGTGTLGADHRVTVTCPNGGVVELNATHVVLASGSAPRALPGFDVDGRTVISSDEVLALEHLPASAAVIGGGAIGCEFASMLSDLGTHVVLLEVLPRLLGGCDRDIARAVTKSFKSRGIDVREGIEVAGHVPRPDGGTAVQLGDGAEVLVDMVVVAVGRRPRSDTLRLHDAEVEVDERGFVRVNENLETSAPGVYAVGDVVAVPGGTHPQLAHVAFAEGIHVVKRILGESAEPIDYSRVPWCVYSHPEVAFAGMTEDDAKAAGREVIIKKLPFSHNGRAMIVGEPEGLLKLVAERNPDGSAGRLLGMHMVGPWATEQLGQGYLAVNLETAVGDLARFIQPHPTMSEQFGEAVLALTGRGLHS